MAETTEQKKKTIQPFDREKIIISSVLFNKECKLFATEKEISEEIFLNSQSKKIMQAFNALAAVGMEPTESLIVDQLLLRSKTKHLNEKQINQMRVEFNLSFRKLKEEYPPESKDALELHIKYLKQTYLLKKYEDMANQVLELVKNKNLDALSDDILKVKHHIENSFFEIEGENLDDEVKSMDLVEGFHYTLAKMKEALSAGENDERVSSGYDEIDENFAGGFNKGNFSLIAARPAMGKTVWMLNSAIETAKTGSKVLFISIEMNLYQCFQRILSKVSNVSAQKIQQPKQMTPKEWKMIEEAGNEISDIYEEKFWIEEVTELTPPQLERKIKHYKKVHDIDIVYVDYAQIMLTKEGNEPKDQADFAQISGALRRVAKAQNVAVVVGSQLSRDVEKRPDKRPVMADIRNSGAFEQDAAQVVGLYRDAVYNPETEKPNVLEFIVLKNRFGKGSVTIEFNYDLDKQAIFSNGS